MAKISVLGGGISGLSTAYYLSHLKNAEVAEIVIYEASKRVGGWINTSQQPSGCYFETGPRSLRTVGIQGANTIALAGELGLEKEILAIPFGHPSTKNRLVSVGGQLHQLPSSIQTIFKKSPPFSKPLFMSILNDLRAPKFLNADESLYSFVNRRFGREVASYLIDPLARGVFAGNARDLSVRSLGKTLHDWEQQFGGIVKGAVASAFKKPQTDEVLENRLVKRARREKWSAWSLSGGIENLTISLEKHLMSRGVIIKKGVKVDKLVRDGEGGISVHHDGEIVHSDHVFSCLPSNQLSPIVSSVSKEIKELLDFIPYVTVAVVNLEFDRSNLIKEPAFGYLIPSTEPSNVLGVIFDTFTFPQGEKTILTVMIGGYWFESLFGKDPSHEVLLSAAMQEIQTTLGIKDNPINHKVSLMRDCIPQYVVGHAQKVEFVRKILADDSLPLTITGNAFDGVGINDTILSAKRAVEALKLK